MRSALIAAAIALAAPLAAQEGTGTATLMTQDGAEVGTVTLGETASGVLHVTLEGTGMPEGEHGLHVHETGVCEGDFSSAGGHLAGDAEHGILVEGGPHPGDLPNLHVPADGAITVEHFAHGLAFDQILDPDGSAIVVHAAADDYRSQPAGASGDRIACGVIEQG